VPSGFVFIAEKKSEVLSQRKPVVEIKSPTAPAQNSDVPTLDAPNTPHRAGTLSWPAMMTGVAGIFKVLNGLSRRRHFLCRRVIRIVLSTSNDQQLSLAFEELLDLMRYYLPLLVSLCIDGGVDIYGIRKVKSFGSMLPADSVLSSQRQESNNGPSISPSWREDPLMTILILEDLEEVRAGNNGSSSVSLKSPKRAAGR
jgi:hypothetical protein